MSELTTLYRFFDDGDLLYVGITNCVPRRMSQHGERKPWFSDATRITLEHFTSRSAGFRVVSMGLR
jgi:predicted GIY-YIG superfamily endonuclease